MNPTQSNQVSHQIQQIFDQNRLNDLHKFLCKRHCLNDFNTFLTFFFYFIQSSGIMITMIGSGYNDQTFIWIGVGLNLLATLINVYEKINNNLLKNMLINIQNIKDNNYVDETQLIDLENISIPTPSMPSSFTNPNSSAPVPPLSVIPSNVNPETITEMTPLQNPITTEIIPPPPPPSSPVS
jgi:hypothetical protein